MRKDPTVQILMDSNLKPKPVPLGVLTGFPILSARDVADLIALRHAEKVRRRGESIRCGGQTFTYSELLFSNTADYTAVASTASEASLLSGVNRQPQLSAGYFLDQKGVGRTIAIKARGVFSNTGTPTLTFQARMGTTAGSSTLTGASVGVSAAITTTSGVTNVWWEMYLELTCSVPGIGTGNDTLFGSGYVMSPAGFASPFIYPLEPTTPNTATWTQTFAAELNQFFNLSVTWSASSASNTIQAKQVYAYGWN